MVEEHLVIVERHGLDESFPCPLDGHPCEWQRTLEECKASGCEVAVDAPDDDTTFFYKRS